MGTTAYMAPEQQRGLHVDHRADIYSLGVMLYEMLCGEVPQGASELPSERCGGLDKAVDAIVTRALSQQPERRYQGAAEMKTALTAVQPLVAGAGGKAAPARDPNHSPCGASPATRPRSPPPPPRAPPSSP